MSKFNNNSVINPDLQAAIAQVVGEGTKVEMGFLDILTNEGIGALNPLTLPNVEIHGDELWFRKNGMQVGGTRNDVFSQGYYSDQPNNITKIRMDETFTIRYFVDISVLNTLNTNYSGQELKDQLLALIVRGVKLSTLAKMDAVYLKLLQNAPQARNVGLDLQGIKAAGGNFQALLGKLMDFHVQMAFQVSDLQSSINSFRLGTSISQYNGFLIPVIHNLTTLFQRGFGSGTEKENTALDTGKSITDLYGVNFQSHPFFNQFVNQKTANWASIDYTKTIFDGSNDYDFTGLVGVVAHNQAAIVPIRLNSFTFLQDPSSSNFIGVVRIDFGAGYLRPDLVVTVQDTSAASSAFASDVQTLLANYDTPAKALVATSGADLKATLQAAYRGLTAGTYPNIDLTTLTVTFVSPTTASTVTSPTGFNYTIQIKSKNPLVSDYIQSNLTAYYKNA